MRAPEQPLTQAEIVAGLQRLGVAPGDALEVLCAGQLLARR